MVGAHSNWKDKNMKIYHAEMLSFSTTPRRYAKFNNILLMISMLYLNDFEMNWKNKIKS